MLLLLMIMLVRQVTFDVGRTLELTGAMLLLLLLLMMVMVMVEVVMLLLVVRVRRRRAVSRRRST